MCLSIKLDNRSHSIIYETNQCHCILLVIGKDSIALVLYAYILNDEAVTSPLNIQFYLILNVNPFTGAKQGEVRIAKSVSSDRIMLSTVSLKMSP